jgi:hypothetical protein
MHRPTARTAGRTLVTALLVLGAMAGGGAASAFWSGSGGGTGAEATGTPASVRLSPGTPAATLAPGGQTGVVLRLSNPNAFPVAVRSLVLDTSGGSGGFAVDAGHAGCAVGTLGFTTQTNGGNGWTVPAGSGGVDGTLAVTLTGALRMGAGAADACQGAAFTVYLMAGP